MHDELETSRQTRLRSLHCNFIGRWYDGSPLSFPFRDLFG